MATAPHQYIKNPDTGKRISKLNPENAWIIHEVPGLRILSNELWQSVKDRQETTKKNTRPDLQEDKPFWAQTRPKYLLSGLIKCGQCGGSYTRISKHLFGCATARNKGTCDNRLNIRGDTLEAIIIDGLRNKLIDPALFKVFVEEFTEELNRLQMEANAESEAARTELARIERQIDKLVMAIADGADALPLNTKIKELQQRQTALKAQLQNASDPAPLLHPNLAELYHAKVANLSALLEDEATKTQAFDIIRSLIEEIRLVPVDGTLRIDLRGELAGILSLCDANKKPAVSYEARAEQIKMVAGAGFEPATFRL